MGGTFSAGGLISGLDSNAIIRQLMQIERQPLIRLQDQIADLESDRDAVRGLRTQLNNLRNSAQDFRFNTFFSSFDTASSEESVLTAEVSSQNPVTGSFDVDVTRLATATVATSSASIGAAINPNVALNSAGFPESISGNTFSINGVEFTFDPDTDSLNSVLGQINSSAAGVTATYDNVTDTVTLENSTPGDTGIINLGGADDDSNLLRALSLRGATQSTGGNGSTVVTSTRNLGAVDAADDLQNVSFAGGAITAGSFSINGVSITVDPATDSLSDIVGAINSSDAGVSASYDSATDSIRVVSETLGSRTIRFGGAGDTSNFLAVTNLSAATQTAGTESEFSINGGPAQTRSTNEVTDAVGGVTLNLLSLGQSTVSVDSDDDAIVENVQGFIQEFNTSVQQIRDLTAAEGALSSDGSIRSIESALRTIVFDTVAGLNGDYTSLVNIGITTGENFDASAGFSLELDEDAFREALRDDRDAVESLFTNDGETGVSDRIFDYLDQVAGINGFLNQRSKSNGTIDRQIDTLNDSIERFENRLVLREERLRRQFTQLETLSSSFQSQASALSGLGAF